ncbi:ATP-binding protein [Limnoglobus roseus]|uniref:Ferredoxin family protein n=1 Tax=Limnoglobus roseus TaxID=2598579 RepID=A0A5C1AHN2_9BACT|nr:ferredoxin family protein [Limnoglobus roseus]QEL16478.1 ferredoxin family protein [Limnoglobus roseus]
MSRKVTVVLSQAPGKNPAKRSLEESIAAALLFEPGVDVSIVPNLYDLGPDHTGRMFLEGLGGDVIVLSWLYPRAAFWLLDRDGIKGHFGETQLKPPGDDDEEEPEEVGEKPSAIGPSGAIPDRHIYTLDLRDFNKPEPYLTEVRRIVAECQDRRAKKAAEKAATAAPVIVQLGLLTKPPQEFAPDQLLAPAGRRWYPVIDYSRCTNCLECLDFCLFGVYGVDAFDRIITENQDQCKKGCPACSRVCPQQAIIFPEYKSAAIAGGEGATVGGLKIDLSKLFGGGDAADPLAAAVAERDRELVADGRAAVGTTVGLPKRQTGTAGPKDDLDKLVDDLDSLGL